jgi:pimeloyl-ACP methyl ester carboxylesterase
LKRTLQAVAGLLLLLAIVGATYEFIAQRAGAREFPQRGESIQLGAEFQNVRLNLDCSGPQPAATAPTVILDSGLGVPAFGWKLVQDEVARFTRVCSYDRAGYGYSGAGALPRTSLQIAKELHALLATAGEKGPFVIVGHSFGGYNVRVYTGLYPDDVAGVVLVDTSHEDQLTRFPPVVRASMRAPSENEVRVATLMRHLGIVRALGIGEAQDDALPAEFVRELSYLLQSPRFMAATSAELRSFAQSADQVRAAGNLGDRPLIVLTAGKGMSSAEFPAALGVTQQDIEAVHRVWTDELQVEQMHLSTRGKRTIVSDSAHNIQFERPDAVTAAIREVWEAVRVTGANSVGSPATLAASATSATSLVAGTWGGVLEAAQGSLRLVLTVTRLTSGEYSAEVDSVDQGSVLPVDSLAVQDRAIAFEIKAVGGRYQGKLNDSGNEIIGTWKQANVPAQALSFKRSAAGAAAATPGVPPGPTEKPFTIPLDVLVPVAPTAFKADGKLHLAYELRVTNMSRWNCVLSGLEVVSGDDTLRSLANFTQADLERMIHRRTAEKSKLAPETSMTAFVWVTFDRAEDVPTKLRHRFKVKIGDYAEILTLETQGPTVTNDALVISPPLRGDRWLAGAGPSNTSAHRRALIPVAGRAAIAQRFAIDWLRIDADGKTFHGDPLENKNYYAYGADALAVADGVVVSVLDGIPSNVPGMDSRAVPITLENIGGNFVILDIGNGNHAFYAHLQPGSLRVKPGDKVRRGQVLGLVGNTGNSTEPHLHFHISNAPSELGAEGLPYELTSFELQGRADGTGANVSARPTVQTLAIPSEGAIVRFGNVKAGE